MDATNHEASSAQDSVATDTDAPNVEGLFDENAFGIWISWFDAEEVEYSQSADKFPPRIRVFRAAVAEYLTNFSPAKGSQAIDFGTSIYLEFAQGDQSEDPIAYLRAFRAYLAKGDWNTFAVLTHGGRWVAARPEARMPSTIGEVAVLASVGPSEAFRKAMCAEATSHDDEDEGIEGWGPGLFVDAEVLDAMGRKLKNDPTPLRSGGACFFRIGAG